MWNPGKTLDAYTADDWVTASRFCTRSEYRRMVRIAKKAGVLDAGAVHDIKMSTVSSIEEYQRANDTERMDQYNQSLIQWQEETIAALRSNLAMMGIGGGELASSLKAMQKKNQYGEINRLGFSFARQGIYIFHGAMNGFGGWKGSHWSYRKKTNSGYINTSEMRYTRTKSMGRLAESTMKDRNWFNPVIERRIEALAKICTEYCDDMIIDATNIYLKR